MINHTRQLIGVSVLWLGLSMLFDGVNTLVLPNRLLGLTTEAYRATILGAITLIGLVIGMFIQPYAGVVSDWLRPRWGRRGTLAVGVGLVVLSLGFFAFTANLIALSLGYILLQITANIAQAAQQGFLPDLIPATLRGIAAGLKGFMDLGGALVGFIVLGQLLAEGREVLALIAIAVVLLTTFLLTVFLVKEDAQPLDDAMVRTKLSSTLKFNTNQYPTFTLLVVARFLFLLGTYAVGRFFLFFVTDRLGLDVSTASQQAGNLLAGLTMITVMAAIPAGWAADKFGRKRMMLFGAIMSAIGVLMLTIAHTSSQVLLFGGLMAIGSAAFASANWALTADIIPAEQAGHFFGLANFGTAGAAALAGIFGPLVDWANISRAGSGYIGLFAISGMAFLASAMVLYTMPLSTLPLTADHTHVNS
jgi:MFS family permease